VKKAVKGQGFVTKTLPLHASNVMYHSEKHNAPIKLKIAVDGKKKTRVSKKYTEKID
jgi:ribosomal protein L24